MAGKILGKVDTYGEGCTASGPGIWCCNWCLTVFRDSSAQPSCPACKEGGNYIWARPNPRRVTGSTYRPYHGQGDWGDSANKVLASSANNNFRNGRR